MEAKVVNIEALRMEAAKTAGGDALTWEAFEWNAEGVPGMAAGLAVVGTVFTLGVLVGNLLLS